MAKKANLIIYIYITYITLLIGCGKISDKSFITPFVIIHYGNPKEGRIKLYLPLSTYYRFKNNYCQFIWKDNKGRNYSFIVVIVKSDNNVIKEALVKLLNLLR